MERVDGLVRTLRNFYILSFERDIKDETGYQPLLNCFTGLADSTIEQIKNQPAAVLKYLITDTTNNNSVRVLLGKARENARGSQDKITKELWEQINSMYHYINQPGLEEDLNNNETLSVLEYLHTQTLLYNGVVDSTMPRGLGWNFMNTGKYIERCLQTVDITEWYLMQLKYNLDNDGDVAYWRHLLLSLSGYELYLKNNRGNLHTRQVIDQVIFNREFTRSVQYALERISKYIEDMTETNPHQHAIALQKQLGRLKSRVEFTDVPNLDGKQIENLLVDIRTQVWDFSAALSKLFFSYT
jgi:uncharacterized alpha-E superfamily protein